MTKLRDQMLEKVAEIGAERVDGAFKDNPMLQQMAKMTEESLTGILFVLKEMEDLPEGTKRIACIAWDLISNLIVPVMIRPDAKSVSFIVYEPDDSLSAISVPIYWGLMVDQNSVEQTGALLFCVSQAIDYYNKKIKAPDKLTKEEKKAAEMRARAHEAEFLLWLQTKGALQPNEYQKKVIEEYPQGLKTESVLPVLYEYMPVPKAGATLGEV